MNKKDILFRWAIRVCITSVLLAAPIALTVHILRIQNGYLPTSPLAPYEQGAYYFLFFLAVKTANLFTALNQRLNPISLLWAELYGLPKDYLRKINNDPTRGFARSALMVIRTLANGVLTIRMLGFSTPWYFGVPLIIVISLIYLPLDAAIVWHQKSPSEKAQVLGR